MLRWALVFLLLGVVTALLSFSGLPISPTGLARIVLYVFAVLFLVALIGGSALDTTGQSQR